MCSTILQSPGNVLEKNTGEPNIYFFHFRPKIRPHLSGFSGSFSYFAKYSSRNNCNFTVDFKGSNCVEVISICFGNKVRS